MGASETFSGRPFPKVLMLQLEVSRAGRQKGKWKGVGLWDQLQRGGRVNPTSMDGNLSVSHWLRTSTFKRN